MPPAARITDINAGCPVSPPTPIIAGSPNVITVGMPQARLSDPHMPHPLPPPVPPHPVIQAAGSGTVLTNSLPSARIGDFAAGCTSVSTGAPTVIIGG